MEALGVLIALGVIGFTFYVVVWPILSIIIDGVKSSRHERKVTEVRELKKRYPDAYQEWFGNESYFSNMSNEELNQRLSKSVYEWQSKQKGIEDQRERERLKRQKEVEKQQREQERKAEIRKQANDIYLKYPGALRKRFGMSFVVGDEMAERVLAIPENELQIEENAINEEMRRRREETEAKYKAIETKYPNGVELIKRLREKRKDIDGIYTRYEKGKLTRGRPIDNEKRNLLALSEEVFKKFEDISLEFSFYEEWLKKQEEFSDRIVKLKKEGFSDWGNYSYKVKIEGHDETGEIKEHPFLVWQVFTDGFCLSDNVSYTYYPSYKEDRKYLELFKNRRAHYNDDVYEKLFSFIESIEGEKSIIIADSGLGNQWISIEEYHFGNIKNKLLEKGYQISHFNEYDQNVAYQNKSVFVIIELFSNNSTLIDNCKKVLLRNKEMQPQIVYFTLDKEYDEAELLELNERKDREIRRKEEEARRIEQQKREREQREEAKRRAIEDQERRKREEAERKEREEREFKQRIMLATTDWEHVAGVPLYFFYWYYPTRFTNISSVSQNVRSLVYRFKDGLAHNSVADCVQSKLRSTFTNSDLSSFTFVCIPASTISVNKARYESFSNDVCSALGMRNAFPHIHITREKTPSRLGGTDSAEYAFDSSFFNGAKVVLFDDIVTRGHSIMQFKAALEGLGATIVCALSIGRTYSDYYGDNREPHPWTGEL